jgi:O-antigen/teichoic acid export membrane protein
VDTPIYSRSRARRSLIDSAALRVVSQISTVIGYLVLVRALPAEQLGVYSLFHTFIAVIGAALSLGLDQLVQRYVPEYLKAGNKPAAVWLVRFVAYGRLAVNVVLLAAILLAWNYVAPLVKVTPYRALFAFFCVLILLHFQLRILQLALGSHMLHRFSVGATVILSLIRLVGYSALAWNDRASLGTAILIDVLAYACAYASLRIAYQTKVLTGDAGSGYRPAATERKRMARYGLLNNFNDAGSLLLYATLDNFFIAFYLDTVSVGIYSFYARLRGMVTNALPVRQFEAVIQPLFFSIRSANASHSIPKYFSFLLNIDLLVQWPVFAYTVAYHTEIVQVLLGGKFIEYSWLLPILMGFATLNAASDPTTLVAQYQEKAGTMLLSKIFIIYNLFAMFLLVPVLGIYGAALAGGTSLILKNAFVWWRVRKLAIWTNAWASIATSVGLWGVAVAVCYGLKRALPVPSLVQLVLGAIVFLVIGLVYVRSPALSASDREIMASIAGDKGAPLLRRIGILPQSQAR